MSYTFNQVLRSSWFLTRLAFQTAIVAFASGLIIPVESAGQATATPKVKQAIQVSLNENPNGPAKGVAERIAREMTNVSRYTDKEGEELVAAIAKREGVSADQIVPGEILEQLGIYLGLKGGAGGEFVYTVPGYPALVNAAARVGGVVISVPLNDKLENDLPALTASITPKTQVVFLVNPHNPSGTVSDIKAFHDFIHQTSSRALVVVDEAYLEFSDDFVHRTAVNNIKEGDNVMVFRTFAKAYGLAGLSIGYAVAPKALAAYLKEQGLGSPHDLNRLSVVAATTSLSDEGYISRINKLTTAERTKWIALLDQLGLKHTTSQANFIYFDTKRSYPEVAATLKENGIIIGRAFAPYDTWIRISIGRPAENKKVQDVIRKMFGPGLKH